MSKFTTPLILEFLPRRQRAVYEPFEYHVGELGSKEIISVPKGFVTDLASIPRVIWSFLPPHDTYGKAAVIHDYCYVHAINSKEWADNVFYESMGVLGIPKWKRKIMYWSVKYFGKGNY